MNLCSGVIASAFCIFVFVFTKGSLESFFSVMLALTISTSALSYFFIFPALLRLRRSHPRAARPYRVPGGAAGAWAAVITTEIFVILTAITLLWPGGINELFGESYSVKASWWVSRAFFEWVTIGSLAVMVALGLVFWLLGERKRRLGITGIAIPADTRADGIRPGP